MSRILKQASADIAASFTKYNLWKGGGGGGSVVEWEQLTTEGAHIATISINGDLTEVYAPNIYNGHEYSEVEKVAGKWIDGRNVYEQVINMENVTYAQEIVIKENVDFLVEENLYYSDAGLKSGSKFPCKGFPQINYWFYNHLLYLRNDNKIVFRLDGKIGTINIKGVIKYVKVNE